MTDPSTNADGGSTPERGGQLLLPAPAARKAILLFAYFFCVIAAFWTLKPLRTSGVIKAFGADYYPLFKQGLVLASPLLVMAVTYTTCFYRRETIIQMFSGLFFLAGAMFWALFQGSRSLGTEVAFFFFVDAFATVMVTLFWTYLNDVYDVSEAKKYYGFIGMGGLLGGLVGAGVAGWAGQALGHQLIAVSGLFLIPVFWIVRRLGRMVDPASTRPVCPTDGRPLMGELFEGATVVARSRYLLSILAIVSVYEIVSTAVDYQFNATLSASIADRDAMAAYQGRVFFAAQLVALLVQGAVVPFIHRRCGIVFGLLFLPLMLFTGCASFLLAPGLAAISLTIGGEASFAYSINQASKEVLYVPLDAVSKYKGKAFIDMFGVRLAKALGAGLLLAYTLWLRRYGVPPQALMVVSLALIVAWLYAIRVVGRGFAETTDCASECRA